MVARLNVGCCILAAQGNMELLGADGPSGIKSWLRIVALASQRVSWKPSMRTPIAPTPAVEIWKSMIVLNLLHKAARGGEEGGRGGGGGVPQHFSMETWIVLLQLQKA